MARSSGLSATVGVSSKLIFCRSARMPTIRETAVASRAEAVVGPETRTISAASRATSSTASRSAAISSTTWRIARSFGCPARIFLASRSASATLPRPIWMAISWRAQRSAAGPFTRPIRASRSVSQPAASAAGAVAANRASASSTSAVSRSASAAPASLARASSARPAATTRRRFWAKSDGLSACSAIRVSEVVRASSSFPLAASTSTFIRSISVGSTSGLAAIVSMSVSTLSQSRCGWSRVTWSRMRSRSSGFHSGGLSANVPAGNCAANSSAICSDSRQRGVCSRAIISKYRAPAESGASAKARLRASLA